MSLPPPNRPESHPLKRAKDAALQHSVMVAIGTISPADQHRGQVSAWGCEASRAASHPPSHRMQRCTIPAGRLIPAPPLQSSAGVRPWQAQAPDFVQSPDDRTARTTFSLLPTFTPPPLHPFPSFFSDKRKRSSGPSGPSGIGGIQGFQRVPRSSGYRPQPSADRQSGGYAVNHSEPFEHPKALARIASGQFHRKIYRLTSEFHPQTRKSPRASCPHMG